MNITSSMIVAGCGATQLCAAQWVQPIQAACDRFQINTPLRIAAFLATIGVESDHLTALSEDLDYRAEALLSLFSTHFTAEQAQAYAHQPERIANRLYANRDGNGDEASGDGWKFRGRGAIQITFHDNYVLCGIGIDLPLLTQPELLEQPGPAAMSAAWYFFNRHLNALAASGDFLGLSKTVNQGSRTARGLPNGWQQRQALYAAAKQSLGLA